MRHSAIHDANRPAKKVARRDLLALAIAAPAAAVLLPTKVAAGPRTLPPRYWTQRIDSSALRPIHASELAAGSAVRGLQEQRLLSTGPISTGAFRRMAVSWPEGTPANRIPQVLLRTRSRTGWSQWSTLHLDSHGPDHSSAEARTSRPTVHSAMVEPSEELELVLAPSSDVSLDVNVHFIQPGTELSSSAATSMAASSVDSEQPAILTRKDWGADETIRESGEPDYGQIRGAFVHHTADPNSYSTDDVPAIIRSIYVYHVRTRGWRDIGYNFLVDRFGRIWEGRYGGIDEPVVGAHTGGYNSSSFGAAVIGTYTTKTPEQVVLRAYRRLIAWKFSMHNVHPLSLVNYPDQKTLPAISGHRDTKATECPGQHLYDALQMLRHDVYLATRIDRRRTVAPQIGSRPVIPPTG